MATHSVDVRVDESEAFPRGGQETLTPLEKKVIHHQVHQDMLFNEVCVSINECGEYIQYLLHIVTTIKECITPLYTLPVHTLNTYSVHIKHIASVHTKHITSAHTKHVTRAHTKHITSAHTVYLNTYIVYL